MGNWAAKARRRKQYSSFNPSRCYLDSAVTDFLKNGGQITKVIVDDKNYSEFVSIKEPPSAADDFLNGV